MGLPWFVICPTKESTFSSESTHNQGAWRQTAGFRAEGA